MCDEAVSPARLENATPRITSGLAVTKFGWQLESNNKTLKAADAKLPAFLLLFEKLQKSYQLGVINATIKIIIRVSVSRMQVKIRLFLLT